MGKHSESNNRNRREKKTKEEKPNYVLIVATIGAVATVIAAIIMVSGGIKQVTLPIEATQTAEALHTSVALTTQAYQMSITATMTASLTPTPTLSPTSTPSLTNTPTPLDDIDQVFVIEIAPQLNEVDDFWFYKNDNGEKFFFTESKNGSLFNFFISPACGQSDPVGLQIDYEIQDADFAGWGLEWVTSSALSFDASGFTNLVIWVKGRTGEDPYQISLTDRNGKAFEIKLRDYPFAFSPDEWIKIEIPLTDFEGVDPSVLTHLSVATLYQKNGRGSICVDDIGFQ